MKTQMQIKTDGRSLFTEESKEKRNTREHEKKKNRLLVFERAIGCAALIAVLAASGYMGTRAQSVKQTTAAPVISREITEESAAFMTYEEAKAKREAERRKELAILQAVIEDENADAETKNRARAQSVQIAQRMENEAGIEGALTHMGVYEAAAISGDGRIVLIIPAVYADTQEKTTRIVDAASAVSGCEAKDVKIILAKK